MDKNFILNTPDVSFYCNSMRKCGYDNYEALCEFSDNSIEQYVESTFCDFSFIKSEDGRYIEKIVISDDGKGIEEKVADTFFNFGVSVKDASCYGGYGMGAKTAALSMGKRITVYTKQYKAPIFKYVFDLDIIQAKQTPLTIKENEESLSSNEIAFFYEKIKNTNSGTVIVVDKLDSLTCKTPSLFKTTLNTRLRKNYSKILLANENISITIENEKITPLSYVGGINQNGEEFTGELLDRITTTYKGCPITIESYFLNTKMGMIDWEDYDIPANQKNCGLFFFRNDRLVGSGLKPSGVITKKELGGDGHSSYFRVLVSYGGEMDCHINLATFNKMINDKKELSDDLRQFLFKHINPAYRTYKKLYNLRVAENNKQKNKEKAAELTKLLKNYVNKHNVKIPNNHGKNNKNDEESKNINQPSYNNTKKRNRSKSNVYECANWIGDVIISDNLTPRDELCHTIYTNGKYDFIINTNHPCYDILWERFDDEMALVFLLYSCSYDISVMKADIEEESKDILLNHLEIIKEFRQDLLHKFFKNLENQIDNRIVNISPNRQTELEFVGTR